MIRFFTKEEEEKIIAAIHEAEGKTSGEIRVHLQRWSIQDVMDESAYTFKKLKMDQTDLRNGVLIYVVPTKHRFAILGDKGINEKVPADFWDCTRDLMQKHFREEDFLTGILLAIEQIGTQLSVFFPRQNDDINELPDDISYG